MVLKYQNSYRRFIVVITTLAAAFAAQGVGQGGSIKSLSDSADAIIVGIPANLSADGVFDLNVVRVLKGTVSSVTLQVSGPASATILPQPSDKKPGIFFLSGGNGKWNLLPLLGGAAPFDENYLSARLDAPASTDADYSERVLAEFDAALDETTILRYRFGFTSLAGIRKSPHLTALYQRLASSSSPILASAGLAGLVSLDDPSAVQRCESATKLLGARAAFLEDLAAAMKQAYRNPDPAGIGALARIASNSAMDVRLQRAAAFSLRAIHTSGTVAALAAQLDSPDQEIRYDAVFGLASFANNYPIQTAENILNFGGITSQGKGPFTSEDTLQNVPGREAFNADEPRYLLFWKQWWAENQAAIVQ